MQFEEVVEAVVFGVAFDLRRRVVLVVDELVEQDLLPSKPVGGLLVQFGVVALGAVVCVRDVAVGTGTLAGVLAT